MQTRWKKVLGDPNASGLRGLDRWCRTAGPFLLMIWKVGRVWMRACDGVLPENTLGDVKSLKHAKIRAAHELRYALREALDQISDLNRDYKRIADENLEAFQFGDKLREWRAVRGFSLVPLAEKLDCSISEASKLERGKLVKEGLIRRALFLLANPNV